MDDYVKRSDVLALQTELRFDQIEQLKHYRCKHIDPLSVKLLDAADVRENVRAEWKVTDVGDATLYARCSHCKREIVLYGGKLPTDFCPHCGAAMKKWEG